MSGFFWYWWIFGLLLLIFEMLAPGVFFLWLAISAAIMGGLLLVFPQLLFAWQLFLFALFSLASVVITRFWLTSHPIDSDHPFLNQRLSSIVGQTFRLHEAIVDGTGKIKIKDTLWQVNGPDLAAGHHVIVVEVNGMRIQVEEKKD